MKPILLLLMCGMIFISSSRSVPVDAVKYDSVYFNDGCSWKLYRLYDFKYAVKRMVDRKGNCWSSLYSTGQCHMLHYIDGDTLLTKEPSTWNINIDSVFKLINQ